MAVDFLSDGAALGDFLARFEDGTWPVAEFHHAHHLAIAACYVGEGGDPMERLRARIRHYNVCQGGENTADRGYHETITRFWAEVVSRFLASLPAGLPRIEVARRVLAGVRVPARSVPRVL